MAGRSAPEADIENPRDDRALFENMTFWVSRSVPQRTYLRGQIEAHGGRVVIREQDANVLLVDHLRKDNPPRTYSYQFVEQSVRKGVLQRLEDFQAGGATRQATIGAIKRTREPFTAEDDRILFDWVKPVEQAGGKVAGMRLYQQLEARYPHHTAQSWRERYLRRVRDLPRPGQGSQPIDSSTPGWSREPKLSRLSVAATQTQHESFTERDMRLLYRNAKHILAVAPDAEDDMWVEFANAEKKQSAEEWKSYFHTYVRPIYETKKKQSRTKSSNVSDTPIRIPSSTTTITSKQADEATRIDRSKRQKRCATPDKLATTKSSRAAIGLHQQGKRDETTFGTQNISSLPSSVHKKTSNVVSPNAAALPPPSRPERNEHQSGSAHAKSTPKGIDHQHVRPSITPSRDDSSTMENEGTDEVEEWIRSRLSRNKGLLSEGQVRAALLCTTLDPILADQVLECFLTGKGIPDNVEGVWTKEDDEYIQGTDPDAIVRVEAKHGREEVDARIQALAEISLELHGELWKSEYMA